MNKEEKFAKMVLDICRTFRDNLNKEEQLIILELLLFQTITIYDIDIEEYTKELKEQLNKRQEEFENFSNKYKGDLK